MQYQGLCGPGRFFDSVTSRCVKASFDICKPGQFDKIREDPYQTEIRETQESQQLEISSIKGPRVVCYVTSWSLYRKGDGLFVPERLDSRLCTDIIYAFAGLNPDTLLIQPLDPWVDIENSNYVKISVSVSKQSKMYAIRGKQRFWKDFEKRITVIYAKFSKPIILFALVVLSLHRLFLLW